jgi:hypothetical protein
VNGSPSPADGPRGAHRPGRGPAAAATPASRVTTGTAGVAEPRALSAAAAVPGVAELADADPDLIAAAVLAVPHVAGLSGGRLGEIATYLPGRRVEGVRIRPGQIEVHVVARYGPTMSEVGAAVHAAVVGAAGPGEVVVGIDDLDVPLPGDDATTPGSADIHAQQRGTS